MLTSSGFSLHMETESNNQFIGLLNHDMRRDQVHRLSNASLLPGALSLSVNTNAEAKRSESAVAFALQKAIQYPAHVADTGKRLKSGELMRRTTPLPPPPPHRKTPLNIAFAFRHSRLLAICRAMFIVDCGLQISSGVFWQVQDRGSRSRNLKINWTKPIGSYLF